MATVHVPQSVEITQGSIRIAWKDGHQSVYPHRFLRLQCQCAHCVDEVTREPRLDPKSVPGDLQAIDHMTVGNYAIQFLWSDAHHAGIYTYELLRAVCTCRQCWEARA